MATESPMRFVGSSGTGKWGSSKEIATFTSSPSNVTVQDLGLLLRDHRFHANGRDAVPSRSGSAPPSMEGSFAAIKNLIGQQSSTLGENFVSLNSAIENCESEEQLRSDPAYLAYYYANVNLNPRLPPPLISWENRHLAHHIGGLGDNRRMISFDDSSSKSLLLSQGPLSTHKEEPEDERSPRQASGELEESISGFLSEQLATSLAGRHKSLVDLIQADFPRTPSPVYNQARSASNSAIDEEGAPEGQRNPTFDTSPSTSSKLQESNTSSLGIRSPTHTPGVHGFGSMLNGDSSSATPIPNSSSPDIVASLCPTVQGESNSADVRLDNGINSIESEMKGFSISRMPTSGSRRGQPEKQHGHLRSHLFSQRATLSQGLGAHSQMATQGFHHLYDGLDHSSLELSNFSTVEMQPVLQTSGITPPLYSTSTAYMTSGNPFFPNLQPPNMFPPHYSMGGYALTAPLISPFFAGYPPPSAIPLAFENSVSPSLNSRPASVSTGGSLAPGLDLQYLNKFYGQLGLALQPSFPDPLYMHYFQHPSEDPYRSSAFDAVASRGGVAGSQDSFGLQKGPSTSYTADQKTQYARAGALSIPKTRKIGTSYGSPPSLGVLMQYPTSPLVSPVLPGSPLVGTSLRGSKNENNRLPLSPSRILGAYSGWQGHSATDKIDDSKHSFLEELKSSKTRRFELGDIAGRIVEFSADQHGSRFIQQKLENCSAEEKASVFAEVLPHAQILMTDVFGNYVIQKFFEHGSPEQRRELANQLVGRILPLSLQMYGCRVVQKALEVIELDQKAKLVLELDGHVMRCVRDQNGNHVIQKCIECIPTEKILFIVQSFRGQVATLSTHPYGCRVIQRVLEHCSDEQQTQCIVNEILQSACSLAQDQYGNYVTQHVLEKGNPHERSQIISTLAGQVVQMSQHKFASNVIEKCLEHGDPAERDLLIEEIVGQTEGNDNLLVMMKDQFANYVVQKILETCNEKQRETLLERIRGHLQALKKYTYGKHIVARVEQLSSEETPSES